MFVGKEVLGYTPDKEQRKAMLAVTAEHMKAQGLPFYMIEAANQLQYDRQDGMYDLADLLDYQTVRIYAMSKEELEKITPEEAAMRFYISGTKNSFQTLIFGPWLIW